MAQAFKFMVSFTYGEQTEDGKIEIIFTIEINSSIPDITVKILNLIKKEEEVFEKPAPLVVVKNVSPKKGISIMARFWTEIVIKETVANRIKLKITSMLNDT